MEIETLCAADMLPVRAHEHDAGADLKAARDAAIRRGDTAKVPTGVRVSIPEGHFGLLAARSSLCGRGLMILNGVGIIDSGYTGEIQVPLANVGSRTQRVAAGERIAQLIIVPCELPTFRRVEALEKTERGEGGFGSTGVDSWEKLEEDSKQRVCSYFGIDKDAVSCDDCPHGSSRTGRICWHNASLDMLARAKKLAGIEEEA